MMRSAGECSDVSQFSQDNHDEQSVGTYDIRRVIILTQGTNTSCAKFLPFPKHYTSCTHAVREVKQLPVYS